MSTRLIGRVIKIREKIPNGSLAAANAIGSAVGTSKIPVAYAIAFAGSQTVAQEKLLQGRCLKRSISA